MARLQQGLEACQGYLSSGEAVAVTITRSAQLLKALFGYIKVKFISMTGFPGQHRIDGDEITQRSFFLQKVKWSFTTKRWKFSVVLPQQCLELLAFFNFYEITDFMK